MFNIFDLFGLGATQRYSVSSATAEKIQKDWQYIKTLTDGGTPAQLKQALITADRSLDTALKDFANGETMGERLKDVSKKFDNDIYNKIWQAHKVRNSLVHESNFEPPHFMLIQNIEIFRKALLSLGVKI